jgi:hypothetical protein
VTKGGAVSEQEKERAVPESEDPDVEGHKVIPRGEEGSEEEIGRRRSDEESDVEAHRNMP